MDSKSTPRVMSAADAIDTVLEEAKPITLYSIAKTIGAQSIQLANYRKGTKPGEKVAARFYRAFNIVIAPYTKPYLDIIVARGV